MLKDRERLLNIVVDKNCYAKNLLQIGKFRIHFLRFLC